MAEFFSGPTQNCSQHHHTPSWIGAISYLGIKIITLTTSIISKREQRITLCDSTAVVVKSAQRFLLTRHSTYFNNIYHLFWERLGVDNSSLCSHVFLFKGCTAHFLSTKVITHVSIVLQQGTNQGKFLYKVLHTSQYVLKKKLHFRWPLLGSGTFWRRQILLLRSHNYITYHGFSSSWIHIIFSGFKHYLGSEFYPALGFFAAHQHHIFFSIWYSKSFQFAFGSNSICVSTWIWESVLGFCLTIWVPAIFSIL